ncbi:MAG: glycoside hydrolase family 127 protein [Promethearchaeota archaeon]
MNYSGYAIHPISLNRVRIKDKFWTPKIETNHNDTIPHVFKKCEKTGRIDNFSRAAGLLNDGKRPIFPFDDSDVFKIIEGAAYSLIIKPDSKVEDYLDNLIEKIAAAQEDDGYLYTTRTINPENPHNWAGKKRWELVSILSHELYNIGHLIEAAIGYYYVTGKRTLLNVAIKSANLVEKDFGPGKIEKIPGHQEIELGLVKLFKITKDDKYLKLAKYFLDIRGSTDVFEHPSYLIQLKIDSPKLEEARALEYNQSHKKIIDQDEAVGHTVRAMYMYSAITDIIAFFNDSDYTAAINRIWNNIVSKKMYITGGIGSRSHEFGESFWDDYKLPNFEAYNETCAAIGNILWNHRLFLLHGEAKYIDVLERILYNSLLSGISIDGKKFFYFNPLSSKGNVIRKSWWLVPCCLTNIVRFIPQIPIFIYAIEKDTIFVNLFIENDAKILLDNSLISITQETNYPWEGNVKITVGIPQMKEFNFAIRVPGWAQNKPVPSDLYYYMEPNDLEMTIKINSELVDYQIEKGFIKLLRGWEDNDVIDINIPMPIRRVLSHENVKENFGKVAIERGPIVYCVESVDNKEASIFDLTLDDKAKFKTDYRDSIVEGIFVSSGNIHFIPYYTWANRGKSEMIVWIKRGNRD